MIAKLAIVITLVLTVEGRASRPSSSLAAGRGRPALHQQAGIDSDNNHAVAKLRFISHRSHLQALMKAPVVALITPMPFLSASLAP